MTTFEEAYARLPKERREHISRALDIKTERLLTPSIGLNLALGGGLGMGRFVTFWGTKSAGKTAFALQVMATAQKQGKLCAIVDAEGTYDAAWGAKLGIDNEELAYTPVRSVAKVTNETCALIKAGFDVVLIDSTTVITPSDYTDEDEFKGFESTGRIGIDSKDLGKMLKSINYVNEGGKALVILIAQGRMGPAGPMHWGLQMSGGKALEFYSSQVIKLQSAAGEKNFKKGHVFKGDIVLEELVGRIVNWKVEFNKLGPQGATGTYDFYFQGDDIGVDTYGEIADLAVRYGILEKSGAWLNYGDQKWQGRDNLVTAMRDDSALYDKLAGELNERI